MVTLVAMTSQCSASCSAKTPFSLHHHHRSDDTLAIVLHVNAVAPFGKGGQIEEALSTRALGRDHLIVNEGATACLVELVRLAPPSKTVNTSN